MILAILGSLESQLPGTSFPTVPDSPMVMKRKFMNFLIRIILHLKFSWLNFLSLPFERLYTEECWMFAPRSRELKFLQYYLQHSVRPGLTILSLERGDLPALYNLARRRCTTHRIVS